MRWLANWKNGVCFPREEGRVCWSDLQTSFEDCLIYRPRISHFFLRLLFDVTSCACVLLHVKHYLSVMINTAYTKWFYLDIVDDYFSWIIVSFNHHRWFHPQWAPCSTTLVVQSFQFQRQIFGQTVASQFIVLDYCIYSKNCGVKIIVFYIFFSC